MTNGEGLVADGDELVLVVKNKTGGIVDAVVELDEKKTNVEARCAVLWYELVEIGFQAPKKKN